MLFSLFFFLLVIQFQQNTIFCHDENGDESTSASASVSDNNAPSASQRIETLLMSLGPSKGISPDQARTLVVSVINFMDEVEERTNIARIFTSHENVMSNMATQSGPLIVGPLIRTLNGSPIGDELKHFLGIMSVRCASLIPANLGTMDERNSARNLCHTGVIFALARILASKFCEFQINELNRRIGAQRRPREAAVAVTTVAAVAEDGIRRDDEGVGTEENEQPREEGTRVCPTRAQLDNVVRQQPNGDRIFSLLFNLFCGCFLPATTNSNDSQQLDSTVDEQNGGAMATMGEGTRQQDPEIVQQEEQEQQQIPLPIVDVENNGYDQSPVPDAGHHQPVTFAEFYAHIFSIVSASRRLEGVVQIWMEMKEFILLEGVISNQELVDVLFLLEMDELLEFISSQFHIISAAD